MKYNNTLTASAHGHSLRDTFGPLAASAGTLAGKVRAGLGRTITHMQISRMQSVLNGMTDDQLNAAEISRSDIPQHARALVLDEYDGL